MRWLTLNPEPLQFRFRFSDEAAPPLDRLLYAEARVSSKDPVRLVKVVRGFSFLDVRFAKDFIISAKYTIRLSLTGLNFTNHFNALDVHANTGDPQFGTFFGDYHRHYRVDFDIIF